MWKVAPLPYVRWLVNEGLIKSFYVQHNRKHEQSRICLAMWNPKRFREESYRTLYMDDGLINPFIRWLQSKADYYDVPLALWMFLPF